MSKNKINWEQFSTEEIKIKLIEFENAYINVENILKEFLKQLDSINIEYINAQKELRKRGEL